MRLLPLLFLGLVAATPAKTPDVAILVISSSKSFDQGLAPLKFSAQDGERFGDIMGSVGRVPKENIVYLSDAKTADLPLAIERVNRIFAGCPECPNKFIFYYSGHADEQGLHFKDGEVGKAQLHQALGLVRAPTKIVLLDSCFAGALARKGVQTAPVFELPKAEFDEPSGSIFISASSGREYSYESESLKGSVFTHHMVAGLSGEADSTGDGIVTVDELYQYVYRETKLHSLLFPSPSQQTPEFVADLAGRGAIALTYPAETNAKLLLDSDIGGQVTIASRDGIQIFKVDKPFGVKKNLQLPSGRYAVSVSQGFRQGNTEVRLSPLKLASLEGSALSWQELGDPLVKKGGVAAGPSTWLVGTQAGLQEGYTANQGSGTAFGASLWGPASRGEWPLRPVARAATASHFSKADGDWAVARINKVQAGANVEIAKAYVRNLTLGSVLGFAQQTQDWHYQDKDDRTFRSTMPAVAVQAGYGVEWPKGSALWQAEARRDFLDAKDSRTGRRILASNYFGLSVMFPLGTFSSGVPAE